MASITEYWRSRWSYFAPKEVLSLSGLRMLARGQIMVQEDAMDALEGFREVVGFPLLVNFGNNGLRGYCSPKEAKQVGRNWSSRHIQGIAFDISSPDVDVGSLHEMALKFGFGGVGFYPKKNFIHVDIRTTPKTIRWEE